MNKEELELLKKIESLPKELNIEIRGLILAQVCLREEIKRLKVQNKFLMKQDNILQTLMQWLYKEQERYRKTLSEKPTNDKEYINVQVTSVALEQIKVVIDKIKELKEKMK